MADEVITVRHVHKSFGALKAVDDLSFAVERGSCFGLLGPNGAGKTTMMKMLYGQSLRDNHHQSVINVFGYDPQHQELEVKYLSGVAPQENNLDEELNVEQNLIIYAKFYNLPRRQARARIGYLLEFLELAEKRRARIKELSGGMKRRLIVVRALLNEPRLLILDEPTASLDVPAARSIRDLVKTTTASERKATILCTHNMLEAQYLCSRVVILNRGMKVAEGTPEELERISDTHGLEDVFLQLIRSEAQP
jgi:lipooligosaccharide transport system ATP-binding protein